MSLVSDPTADELDRLLTEHPRVAIDFTASWCAPCKSFTPKFQRAAREALREGRRGAFVTVDIDARPEIAKRFGVKSVPTLVVAERRKTFLFGARVVEVVRFSGDKPAPELTRLLQRAIP